MGKSVLGRNSVSLQSRPVCTLRACASSRATRDRGFAASGFLTGALEAFGCGFCVRTLLRGFRAFVFVFATRFGLVLSRAALALVALALATVRFAALGLAALDAVRLAAARDF